MYFLLYLRENGVENCAEMEIQQENDVVRAQAFFKKTRKGKVRRIEMHYMRFVCVLLIVVCVCVHSQVIRIVEQRYMRDDANYGFLCGKELSRVSLVAEFLCVVGSWA